MANYPTVEVLLYQNFGKLWKGLESLQEWIRTVENKGSLTLPPFQD